jgi:BlaI family penicillinase repressor
MSKAPKISEAEWKIMAVLWEAADAMPAYDIIEKTANAENWHPKTIKTLLNRLVKKGALGYRKYKNLYLYFPLVTEGACVRSETESLLQRCFHGSVVPMLAHFVERKKLTAAEIQELKRILAEREK